MLHRSVPTSRQVVTKCVGFIRPKNRLTWNVDPSVALAGRWMPFSSGLDCAIAAVRRTTRWRLRLHTYSLRCRWSSMDRDQQIVSRTPS